MVQEQDVDVAQHAAGLVDHRLQGGGVQKGHGQSHRAQADHSDDHDGVKDFLP